MVFCGRRVTTSINLPREQALLVEYNECISQRLTGERATFQLRDFNHHVGLLVHVWRLRARGARRFLFWKGWWDGGRQGVLLVWQLARNSGNHQLLSSYHCLSHRHRHWHTKYKFIAKHLSRSAKLFSNFICIFQIVKFKVPHCGGRTVLLAKIIGIQRHHNLDLGGKHIREYSGERQAERKD